MIKTSSPSKRRTGKKQKKTHEEEVSAPLSTSSTTTMAKPIGNFSTTAEKPIPTKVLSRNGTLIIVFRYGEDSCRIKFSKNTDTLDVVDKMTKLTEKTDQDSSKKTTQRFTITVTAENQTDLFHADDWDKASQVIGNVVDKMKKKSFSNHVVINVEEQTSEDKKSKEEKVDNKEVDISKVPSGPKCVGKRKSFETDTVVTTVDSEDHALNEMSNAPLSPVEDLGIVGLKNLRNTCFANVVLQSLSNTTPFRWFFHNIAPSESAVVVQAMKDLLATMWSGQTMKDISPERLVNTMITKGISYEVGTEEDASWFLQELLQTLDEELQADGSNRSVTNMFESRRDTEIICQSCGHDIVHSTEQATICTLSLPHYEEFDACTLDDCFKNVSSDIRECKNCNITNPPTARRVFWTLLPQVLCIHFNRYVWTGQVVRRATRSAAKAKISTAVLFPIDLDLSPYLPGTVKAKEAKPFYKLVAIIVHEGLTPATGHYYVLCFNTSQGKWYRFDDNRKPQEVKETSVYNTNPFMLFYLKT